MKKQFVIVGILFSLFFVGCGFQTLEAPVVKLSLSEETPATTVLLTWNEVSGARGYKVTKKFVRDGIEQSCTYSSRYSDDGTPKTFEDSYCESDTEYTYTVVAFNYSNFEQAYFNGVPGHELYGPDSESVSITTKKDEKLTLDFPSNFQIKVNEDDHSLELSWNPVLNAEKYVVYNNDYNTTIRNFFYCPDPIESDTNSIVIKDVYPGSTLAYWVKPFKNNGEYGLTSPKQEAGLHKLNTSFDKPYVLENGRTHYIRSDDFEIFKVTLNEGIFSVTDNYYSTSSMTVFSKDRKILVTDLIFSNNKDDISKDPNLSFDDHFITRKLMNDIPNFVPGEEYYLYLKGPMFYKVCAK